MNKEIKLRSKNYEITKLNKKQKPKIIFTKELLLYGLEIEVFYYD